MRVFFTPCDERLSHIFKIFLRVLLPKKNAGRIPNFYYSSSRYMFFTSRGRCENSDSPKSGPSAPRGSEVLQITVPMRKTHCSPYKFKIAGLVKKWTIWVTFGTKFPVFLLVDGHLRAVCVPIGPL
jgi:hypothetical protein